MKPLALVRRNKWSIAIIAAAVAAWWIALDYLVDFRQPDVPFVATPNDVVAALLDLAEVSDADTVYDLGSGDGRVLFAAAKRGAKAIGIEIDPGLVDQSRSAARSAALADLVTIRQGDLFRQDLRPATVITLYLKPHLNAQLRPQLERLRPGTRVVSHMFSMPGAEPANKIVVRSAESNLEHPLYLWVAPIDWES